MGYFKRKRIKRESDARKIILEYISKQAQVTEVAIGVALRKVDVHRFEYEDNMRDNLSMALESVEIQDDLVDEVAKIIEEGMQLYTFRLAKGKREQLAKQILFDLAIKK
jgi:hypothetical protein